MHQGSGIPSLEAKRLRDEAVLVRVLLDAFLGRLARTVTRLLVDADQQRMRVVGLQMLQRRGMLERVKWHDAVVICASDDDASSSEH